MEAHRFSIMVKLCRRLTNTKLSGIEGYRIPQKRTLSLKGVQNGYPYIITMEIRRKLTSRRGDGERQACILETLNLLLDHQVEFSTYKTERFWALIYNHQILNDQCLPKYVNRKQWNKGKIMEIQHQLTYFEKCTISIIRTTLITDFKHSTIKEHLTRFTDEIYSKFSRVNWTDLKSMVHESKMASSVGVTKLPYPKSKTWTRPTIAGGTGSVWRLRQLTFEWVFELNH